MARRKKELFTGSQIVIKTLIEQGVTDVFGYPGGAVLGIYDELYKSSDKIKHILTAHEEGASHAADGWARTTGKVGVVIATSGPGATNLVTGIATAMLDSVPMVAITGNVPTYEIGKDSFQEINITGVTMPITKHNYFVTDVRELADTIREAFQIAKSGRPGPVLVDIPADVQAAECEFVASEVVETLPLPVASDCDVEKAIALINKAKRPYIYIGGGALSAGLSETVRALAERTDAYIGSSLMGLSALPSSYKRFLGMQGMHGRYASSMAMRQADLIIGLGVRFSDRATGDKSRYAEGAKIIQIDADISEINKNIIVDVGIVGDLKNAAERILAGCAEASHPLWGERIEKHREGGRKIAKAVDTAPEGTLTPRRIFDVINAVKAPDTVIATDVGQHQMWTAQYARLERERSLLTSGGLGTMGYGLGAAIGASVAGGKRTLLITGDGSFGMNLNELATAVTYNLPITVVLFNNGALGMVRQWQTLFNEKRYSSTVLERKTDFVKLAEAFGAKACRVSSIGEFKSALEDSLLCDGPYLIDAAIGIDEFVLPMLPPGGSIDDIIVEKEMQE